MAKRRRTSPRDKLGECVSCGLLCRFDEGTLYADTPEIFVLCNDCQKKTRWVLEVGDRRIIIYTPGDERIKDRLDSL